MQGNTQAHSCIGMPCPQTAFQSVLKGSDYDFVRTGVAREDSRIDVLMNDSNQYD